MIDAQREVPNKTEASTTIKNVIDANYSENITDSSSLVIEPRHRR